MQKSASRDSHRKAYYLRMQQRDQGGVELKDHAIRIAFRATLLNLLDYADGLFLVLTNSKQLKALCLIAEYNRISC